MPDSTIKVQGSTHPPPLTTVSGQCTGMIQT